MFWYHEQLYRTEEVMLRLRKVRVTVCGAGALGANLAENLARQGFTRLRVIDRDRVEERNLSTQPYQRSDIGQLKARILANILFRSVGVEVEAHPVELTAENAAKLLTSSDVVVDCFDNRSARKIVKDFCTAQGIPCLHLGLNADYAEVIWDEFYRIPDDVTEDVCDYPLARNIVLLTVAVAAEVLIRFAVTGERQGFTITLSDFAVQPLRV